MPWTMHGGGLSSRSVTARRSTSAAVVGVSVSVQCAWCSRWTYGSIIERRAHRRVCKVRIYVHIRTYIRSTGFIV